MCPYISCGRYSVLALFWSCALWRNLQPTSDHRLIFASHLATRMIPALAPGHTIIIRRKTWWIIYYCRCKVFAFLIAPWYWCDSMWSVWKTVSNDKSQKGCISQLAERFRKEGTLSQVLDMLEDSDIDLHGLHPGEFLAVGAVHQLKGFEHYHVAVYRSSISRHLIVPRNKNDAQSNERTERNCLFVARTRHRCSLTILLDIHSSYKSWPIYNTANQNEDF